MLTVEKLAQELKDTPEMKRILIMRVTRELLDSEAFMEAYPHVYDRETNKTEACEQMAKIITRFLRKNQVSKQDADFILCRAMGLYKLE